MIRRLHFKSEHCADPGRPLPLMRHVLHTDVATITVQATAYPIGIKGQVIFRVSKSHALSVRNLMDPEELPLQTLMREAHRINARVDSTITIQPKWRLLWSQRRFALMWNLFVTQVHLAINPLGRGCTCWRGDA